ncbi:MAG: hypothetical protein IKQ46_01925 [Bacteroidales bacterium]|nr:hypothetical protein [Bacteroidales bacterium]
MSKFTSLKELFSMLRREEKILTDFFQKRKLAGLKYDYVVDILEDDDDRLRFLVNKEVVRENSGSYELDGLFLNFFEQVLDTNEEINVAYINENIETIKQNINYYANEKSETKRREYLRKIKNTLRNIANITIRNIISLKRNVDNTYKNEANYKNKKLKLQNFDKKSNDINTLITQAEKLVDENEQLFFKTAADDELNNIIISLKINLDKSKHNLIEIKKQIINFLNQIQAQNVLIEKLHKIKYLKDQVTLKSSTDIEKVLLQNNAVVFESLPQYPLKLSLNYLQTDETAHETILKIAARKKTGVKMLRPVADEISSEYLDTQTENEIIINHELIKNAFLASGYNSLWDFAESYKYPKEVSFEDMVLIYCQIVSLYEKDLTITADFQEKNGVKIAVVTKS